MRRVVRYPGRHIRWKIIAPYAGLSLLIALAGTYLVTRLVVGSLEERFNNRLAEAARVTSDSFVRRERSHLEVVRSIAFTEGAAQAASEENAWALADIAGPVGANGGAELIEVLGDDGGRIVGLALEDGSKTTYRPLSDDGGDRAAWPIVQQVLAGEADTLGDKFAQIIETEGGMALYTAGPIREGGEIVGVVLVGSRLASFLPVAKNEALADITLYDFDGRPLVSTFTGAGNDDDADLRPAPGVFDDAEAMTAVRESKEFYGRGFDLLYGELVIRDEAVGRFSVALPTSFIVEAGSSARSQIGGLFAVGILAVLGVGWLVARGLTRPLLQLVSVARAVTDGDLNARAALGGEDEVGLLAESFDEMTARLQRQHLSTIKALTGAIDARDPYTLGHSVRVGQLAVMLGEEIGVPEDQLQHLEIGGYLHDIGKIGVRDSVLLKPGMLEPRERAMIEQHPTIGLQILEPVDLPRQVLEFVGHHHEKLDGSGYPDHLHGEQIPIVARIGTVADIYDALVTDRPYKRGFTPDETIQMLKREVGEGKLDTVVVGAMERIVRKWEARRRTDPSLKGRAIPAYDEQAA